MGLKISSPPAVGIFDLPSNSNSHSNHEDLPSVTSASPSDPSSTPPPGPLTAKSAVTTTDDQDVHLETHFLLRPVLDPARSPVFAWMERVCDYPHYYTFVAVLALVYLYIVQAVILNGWQAVLMFAACLAVFVIEFSRVSRVLLSALFRRFEWWFLFFNVTVCIICVTVHYFLIDNPMGDTLATQSIAWIFSMWGLILDAIPTLDQRYKKLTLVLLISNVFRVYYVDWQGDKRTHASVSTTACVHVTVSFSIHEG